MMRLFFTATLLLCNVWVSADEPDAPKLAAPPGWGGESIKLPPGFAPGMSLKGVEHIRFAPGMMQATADDFFCYAFVFELDPKPELTEAVIREQLLVYYRGLCKAVIGTKVPVDVTKFSLDLKVAAPAEDSAAAEKRAAELVRYTGLLKWVEPFATLKPQELHLEVQTYTRGDRNYLFACVSPRTRDAAIWTRLRRIRDGYMMQRNK